MNWEFDFLNYIQSLRCSALDWFFPLFTKLGDAGIIWIVLAIILLINPKTRKTGSLIALALVIDVIMCNCIIKPLVARIRPYDINSTVTLLIARQHDYSFPSGHTAASFAAVTAIFLEKERKLFIPSLVIASLIAFSRLYLYVHYPTDVLAGIVFGIISGIAGYFIYELIQRRLENSGKFQDK